MMTMSPKYICTLEAGLVRDLERKATSSVFSALSFSLCMVIHVEMAAVHSSNFAVATCISASLLRLTEIPLALMSSASRDVYSKGPNTLPCGTPK